MIHNIQIEIEKYLLSLAAMSEQELLKEIDTKFFEQFILEVPEYFQIFQQKVLIPRERAADLLIQQNQK